MNWKLLEEEGQVAQILEESQNKLVLVFKNSTRCSTSALALNRLERDWNEEMMTDFIPYYVDVINKRNVSQKVAAVFGVEHESPQALVIKDGECIYHQSHLGIRYAEIEKLKDKISV